MPESRWINPIFGIGAFTSFIVILFLLTLFTPLPNWAELFIAYISGAVGGMVCVGTYFHYYPDAIYLTKDKIDGLGYVWLRRSFRTVCHFGNTIPSIFCRIRLNLIFQMIVVLTDRL
jgi:hypothetical protein